MALTQTWLTPTDILAFQQLCPFFTYITFSYSLYLLFIMKTVRAENHSSRICNSNENLFLLHKLFSFPEGKGKNGNEMHVPSSTF